MNCPDCVNVLRRKRVGGVEDTYCLLDFRSVTAIIECNRFNVMELKVEAINPYNRYFDPVTGKDVTGNPFSADVENINPLTDELNKKEEKKHRGWPKGKKRQI